MLFHLNQALINAVSHPLEGNAHQLKRLRFIDAVVNHGSFDAQRSHSFGQSGMDIGVTRKVTEPVRLAFDKQSLHHRDALNALTQGH